MGRSSELRAVEEHLDAEPGAVVLAGPGGVGKTRLAVEVLRLAEQGGCRVKRLTATRSAAGVPLAAFAPLLEGTEESQNGNAFSRVRDALRQSDGRRGLLLVDDAHLLDAASAALVLQMAADESVSLVVTIRTGEPAPDAVTALWKDGHAVRLDVEALSDGELAEMAAAFAGRELEPATARYLVRLASGSALALRELVMGALAAGRLGERHGQLRLSGPVPITDRLTELVAGRLGNLDGEARRALELVALGEPLPVAALIDFASLRVVESLEQQRLIDVRADGGEQAVWMSHPLHGELLREQLLPLRRTLLVEWLCERLEAKPGRTTTEDIQLARWWMEVGRPGDPAVFRTAAHACVARGDAPACVEIAAAGWERAKDVDVGYLLGHSLVELGRNEAAVPVLEQVQAMTTDDSLTARTAGVLSTAHRRLGAVEVAGRVLDDVAPKLSERAACEVVAMKAVLLMGGARFGEASALIEPLMAAAPVEDMVSIGAAATVAMNWQARPEDALEVALRARPAAAALWERSALVLDLTTYDMNIAQAHTNNGALELACDLIGRLRLELAAHATAPAVGALGIHLAFAWHERGRLTTAQECIRRAVGDYRSLDDTPWLRYALARHVLIAAQAGALDEAAAAAAELPATHTVNNDLFGGEELVGLAWLAWARGDPHRAAELVEGALDWARAGSGWVVAVHAAHTAQRLGLRPATPLGPLVDELRPMVQGNLLLAKLDHVAHGLRNDGQGLEEVAARFAAMGADLYAAEAFADASRAHRRAKASRAAQAAARRSAELAAVCEGTRSPALKVSDDLVPLSPREREVALMAAGGLTTPEIAERLYLSKRTVQNHLNRAYEKLGVTSRRQLAQALDGMER